MEKKKGGQVFAIVALSLAVIIMSVGFATFTRDLNINGTANVGASKWDVHFKSNTYQESTGSIAATSHDLQTTVFEYNITLNKTGDFYEATVDVENSGDFDANLVKITMSTLSEERSKYLTYKLYYDGTEYTQTSDISGVTLAKNGGTSTVKVRVDYIVPENESELPTEGDSNITLTAVLSYKQAA